ncbi:uncharacterized protein BDR25DRAFT_359997 [Lindgomyces ingoldianus]|uniref:Uncharacterized protein n=1 Tax=Lindgomyces ingoldianus TaxID=673940 RepID=A0ACB6QFU4_9PLEO|nr:uncharacterized protein BDR25DRAFT_359997 [Lindgomyces ingoldianus]KAF2465843.1 hypothetical protein BDR25DRAFT_359997 [Lindgomyces ingoldianus]
MSQPQLAPSFQDWLDDNPERNQNFSQQEWSERVTVREIIAVMFHAPLEDLNVSFHQVIRQRIDDNIRPGLAEAVLGTLVTGLNNYSGAADAIRYCVTAAKEKMAEFNPRSRGFGVVVALGVLVQMCPDFVDALGFTSNGVRTGSFAHSFTWTCRDLYLNPDPLFKSWALLHAFLFEMGMDWDDSDLDSDDALEPAFTRHLGFHKAGCILQKSLSECPVLVPEVVGTYHSSLLAPPFPRTTRDCGHGLFLTTKSRHRNVGHNTAFIFQRQPNHSLQLISQFNSIVDMTSFISASVNCLTGSRPVTNDFPPRKRPILYHDPCTTEDIAEQVIQAIMGSKEGGKDLKEKLDDIWTLAKLEQSLEQPSNLSQLLKHAFNKAIDMTEGIEHFVEHHPIFCTVLALGS